MKQRNVQQQNALTEAGIRSEAKHWRTHPLPPALLRVAGEKGVDFARSIVLWLEINFPGMPALWGLLLTEQERFIEFMIDTDETFAVVLEPPVWRDITDKQNLSEHNQGFGIGAGALALKILGELNQARGI